jgi:Brp/Blh family beta-carotene 15,15'-monooxygenase
MTMAAKTAGFSAATPHLRASSPAAGPWRPAADRLHGVVAVAALTGAALVALASPGVERALIEGAGGALLVGAALIGVPHGSSDFVVAFRLMHPRLGWRWLPWFLVLYLALVGATLAAWWIAPLPTLLGFLAISGLHFGWGDLRGGAHGASPVLAAAVRATTPILPIFLIHPAGVAGFVAALGGVSEDSVLAVLLALRWPLLLPWGAALLAVVLPPLLARSGPRAETRAAAELGAIALAAAALPPLLAFGLYFCLVHAVRHMLDLAEEVFPRRPTAAALLAAGVVVPSGLVCLGVLFWTWDGLGGVLGTDALITWGLRIVAALTVPHMVLEGVAARRAGRD